MVATRRYCLVAAVTLFVSCGLYLELSRVPSTGHGSLGLLQYLFSTQSIPAEAVVTLCYFSVYKFFATLLSVTLPLPVGLFTPTFVIGGLIGRILGALFQPLRVLFRLSKPLLDTLLPQGRCCRHTQASTAMHPGSMRCWARRPSPPASPGTAPALPDTAQT